MAKAGALELRTNIDEKDEKNTPIITMILGGNFIKVLSVQED